MAGTQVETHSGSHVAASLPVAGAGLLDDSRAVTTPALDASTVVVTRPLVEWTAEPTTNSDMSHLAIIFL